MNTTDLIKKLEVVEAMLSGLSVLAGCNDVQAEYNRLRADGTIRVPDPFLEGSPDATPIGKEHLEDVRVRVTEVLAMLGRVPPS